MPLDAVLGLLQHVRIIPMLAYTSEAAQLAHRPDHPVGDCVYAVVAGRERARLVTADRRFAAKLARGSPRVVPVSLTRTSARDYR